MQGTPDILAKIVAEKRPLIPKELSGPSVERVARTTLAQGLQNEGLNVIAEIKRRSPSAGEIATLPDVQSQAQAYVQGGAIAISVLTEENHFGGSAADLRVVAQGSPIPVLRKDFVVEPMQIREAAHLGASIVLLIAAILEPAQAWEFHELAAELGMETIFEIHSEHEYEPFATYPWPVVGINNRDLHRFVTDAQTTERVLQATGLDKDGRTLVVSESGFHSLADFENVRGAHGYLVGESLSKSGDPALTLQQWRAQFRRSQ